jgi:acetolactate synthase II small subunit
MNEHTLRITAHDQPTVLERLLQVTRYRGFTVTGMTMFPNKEENMLAVELSVRSDQTIDRLKLQLDKLIDVTDISIDCSSQQQCSA